MRRAAIVAALWLGAIAPAGAGLCGAGAGAMPCPSWPGDAVVQLRHGRLLFAAYFATPAGVAIVRCWQGQRVTIDGQPWCAMPRRR